MRKSRTASPRYSRRSLLAPPALRCVSARSRSLVSANSCPRARAMPDRGLLSPFIPAQGELLVELEQELQVRDQLVARLVDEMDALLRLAGRLAAHHLEVILDVPVVEAVDVGRGGQVPQETLAHLVLGQRGRIRLVRDR